MNGKKTRKKGASQYQKLRINKKRLKKTWTIFYLIIFLQIF